MHPRRMVHHFCRRYPFVGPIIWMLSTQYFILQFTVAQAWPRAYNWADNLISDLGNTACGSYAGRYVCSPEHGVMNASFIILGITMAIGSVLLYQMFERTRGTLIGFSMMATSGLGTVLVGMFPENVLPPLHGLGAFLALVVGNVSLLALALSLQRIHRWFRIYTFLSGCVSLAAFVLFSLHISLGIGRGNMERVVSYPQTIWLIIFGMYMTLVRVRARSQRHRRSN